MVKLSKYNIDLGNNCFYNSLHDTIIEDPKRTLDSISAGKGEKLDDNVKQVLFNNGFIVTDEFDELGAVEYIHNKEKFNTNHASLIIYPSLKCNFNCYYCFEKNKNSVMTTKNAILFSDFLVKLAERSRLSKMSLRWSGGEPLLAWKKIKLILDNVKVGISSDVKILNTIATNGYLLDKNTIHDMVNYDFQNVTVTLDGPKEIHDLSRNTINGKPTFNRIVSNIEYLCNYLPTTIRINIDIRNKDCFESLLKQLSKYKIANREVELFCKPIIPCWDCVKDSSMFDMISFFEIEKDFIKVAKEFGFKYSFHPNMRAGIRCPYYHINSFMIDAELYVYKCSLLVGEKNESIGRVTEDKQITICDVDKYYKAVNLSPINIEECKECSILPLCYGKCPILWKNSGHLHNEGCIPEKGTIIEKIKYLYNV